ncbi:hypothetical protein D3C75_614660 [compost metagenome]
MSQLPPSVQHEQLIAGTVISIADFILLAIGDLGQLTGRIIFILLRMSQRIRCPDYISVWIVLILQ